MGMSVPEPRHYPTAAGYGNADAGSFVSQNQQPLYIPPEQFASLDTPTADTGTQVPTSKTTINFKSPNRGKFFGDKGFFGPDYQKLKNPNGQF
jgi:hypothetical protein